MFPLITPKRVCVLYYLGLTVNTKLVKQNWDINEKNKGLELHLQKSEIIFNDFLCGGHGCEFELHFI